jgi:eukaryotic-like serine/threonine-protein kinase
MVGLANGSLPAATKCISNMMPRPSLDNRDDDPAPFAPQQESVETLAWEALANTPDPLDAPNTHPAAGPTPDSAKSLDTAVGSQIGSYFISSHIQTCNFWAFYQATHVDDPSQFATLQVVHSVTSPDQFLAHFRGNSALRFAAGKHTNVPALLETGFTDSGQPYLVFEPVDGLPIDTYCDNLKLNIAERLKLFARVCDVVQFAHQHTVIHHDLKPSNIRITADGALMILNFGIANLLTIDTTASKSTLVPLDPGFTSPEQVMGEPLTTAVDIYALGAILYSLLTGRGPSRLENPSKNEALQAVCEQIAEKPSKAITRTFAVPESSTLHSDPATSTNISPSSQEIATARGTSVHRLVQTLSGDLDSITLMALRKEPSRRYASANQFADDIRCYQSGRPVRAHRDSQRYRLVKFVRRHTVLTTVAIVTLLTSLIGLLITTSALTSTRRDRDQAVNLSNEARRTIDQLFTHTTSNRLFDQLSLQPQRKTLLEDVKHFYQALLDQNPMGFSQPADHAEAASRLARISDSIEPPAVAAERYMRARDLWEKLAAEHATNQDYQEKLSSLLTDFATVLTSMKGKFDQALQSLHRARELINPLLTANPRSIPIRRLFATTFLNEALIFARQGHPDQAITSIDSALSMSTQLADDDPSSLDTQLLIANVYSAAGSILASKPAEQLEAVIACNKAVEIRQNILQEHPEFDEQAYCLACDQNDLGNLLQRTGQSDLALQTFRRSLDMFERLDQRYPKLRQYQLGRGIASNAIAERLRDRNEAAESLTIAQNARDLLLRLLAQYPQDPIVRLQLARSHNIIGRLLERSGLRAEALRSFQRAIDLYETMMPNLEPSNIYNLACNVSLSIPLIGQQPATAVSRATAPLQTKADQLRRSFYGDRAMQALRLASRGSALSSEMLETNTDLDPLRQRPDFSQLLKDVENQSLTNQK